MVCETMRINWSHYAKVCEVRREMGLPVAFDLFYAINKQIQLGKLSLLKPGVEERTTNYPLQTEIIYERRVP